MSRLLIEHVLPRAIVQSWSLPGALVKETQKIVWRSDWNSVRLFRRFSSKIFSFSCFLMFSSFDAVAGAFPARPLVRIFLPEVFRTLFSACVESHTRRIRCALASPTASFDCTIFKRPNARSTLRSRALRSPVARFKRLLFHSFARAGWRRLAGVTRSYPRHQCDSVNLIKYRMIECVPKTRT